MTDLSVIAEQIEHISKCANNWCNFALICGAIGFVLSVAAAILLIKKTKEENDGTVNSDAG